MNYAAISLDTPIPQTCFFSTWYSFSVLLHYISDSFFPSCLAYSLHHLLIFWLYYPSCLYCCPVGDL